ARSICAMNTRSPSLSFRKRCARAGTRWSRYRSVLCVQSGDTCARTIVLADNRRRPMMQAVNSPTFQSLWLTLCYLMRTQSQIVQTERWQGVSTKKDPAAATHELLNVSVSVHLQGIVKLDHWRQDIQPNLPWADDHFEERVCGQPINP